MRLNQKVGDMDSIYLFLLIAFAMGAKAFVESFKKKADELESESDRTPYLDEDELPELHFPKGQKPNPQSTPTPVEATMRPANKPAAYEPLTNQRKEKSSLHSLRSREGERSTAQNPVTPPHSATEEKPLELATDNIEEIRKAIIWSEILHPKYR